MSDTTPLEQIRDHLQAVLDIMTAEYPFQLDNNGVIVALICDAWGEIISTTRTKDVSLKAWYKEAPKTPSVDRQALNESICTIAGE